MTNLTKVEQTATQVKLFNTEDDPVMIYKDFKVLDANDKVLDSMLSWDFNNYP